MRDLDDIIGDKPVEDIKAIALNDLSANARNARCLCRVWILPYELNRGMAARTASAATGLRSVKYRCTASRSATARGL
jgi:hypothetical protein